MPGEFSIESVKDFMRMIPFNRFIGLELDELTDGYCRMSLEYREELVGDFMRGALHGGVISAMIDTAGGAAVWSRCGWGDRLSTVDLRVDYLRPGLKNKLLVESTLVRLGNRVGVADSIAYHPGKKAQPVATGKAVYNVKRADQPHPPELP